MNSMRRNPLAFGAASAALFFATTLAAFAAGGSGGGTPVPPACDRDVWNCSEWGGCSGGARTRVCTLVTDCASASTPKPSEREACATGGQGCTADTWVCGEWPACDPQGAQRRECRLTTDCPGVQTAKPVSERPCPTLQCGDLPSLRERVACRMKLEPAGMARENEIRYLPELCRAQADDAAKAACITLYRSFAPCWSTPAGPERTACAKGVLGLAGDLKAAVVECKNQDEPAKTECLAAIRAKVYDLTLFRIYDLEERAEELREQGVPESAIVDLSVAVEEKKIAFKKAATKEGRKAAVLEVRAAWQKFLTAAKPYLR